MEKDGKTKRQHYVPQMVLRKFSRDGVTTSLLVAETGLYVERAPIKRQCYEPYFYGSDQALENAFAEEESKVARHLGDLSASHLNQLPNDAIRDIARFVYYQQARTRAAAEHLSNFATAFVKSAIRSTAQLNGDAPIDEEVLKHIRLRDAQIQSIVAASKTFPILLDLAVKFILTDRTPGFMVGDHPVVAYNQFAEHHPVLKNFPTSTGLALKGLQLFMPLSPSVTFAMYDPVTYEYGGKSGICRAGPADVRFLNRMQAVNAWECLFFDNQRFGEAEWNDALKTRRSHPSHFGKRVSEGKISSDSNSRPNQFIVVTHRDIKIGAKLSFVRTMDHRSYQDHQGPTVPVRSPELLDLVEQYMKVVEENARARAAESGETT